MSESEFCDDILSLRDEVRLLRQVVDELLDEVSWANNNAHELSHLSGNISAHRRVRSMSLDPASPDFEVNAVDETTVSMLRQQSTKDASSEGTSQQSLF